MGYVRKILTNVHTSVSASAGTGEASSMLGDVAFFLRARLDRRPVQPLDRARRRPPLPELGASKINLHTHLRCHIV